MFWNKKRDDQLIDIVNTVCSELTKRINKQDAKLDLILDHLKLKYVPETETKEPAKLVEKTVVNTYFANLENGAIVKCPDGLGFSFITSGPTSPTPTKPKKRGRPKKK